MSALREDKDVVGAAAAAVAICDEDAPVATDRNGGSVYKLRPTAGNDSNRSDISMRRWTEDENIGVIRHVQISSTVD